jgi:peptidoglycan L-alanyl-D-glutamate endopeptidase CwlK
MDERSSKNLATLHPQVIARFQSFILEAQQLAEQKGLSYKVICGTRSWEEQARIYAQGRTAPGKIVTKAPPGFSMHNFGLAIDCGVFRSGAYLDESEPKTAAEMHKAASLVAAKHGIRWGGNFMVFLDTPHFELDTALSLSQLRDRKKANEWVEIV